MAYSALPTVSPGDTISSSLWGNIVKGNIDFLYAALPKRAEMFMDTSLVTVGTALLRTIDTSHAYGWYVRQTTPADGDAFTNAFLLAPGTYTMNVLGQTRGANAKLDWYIDGVAVATGQDWYSGTTTDNVIKQVSVTIATGGWLQLKGVINGRNGAASDWRYCLTKVWFAPSAD